MRWSPSVGHPSFANRTTHAFDKMITDLKPGFLTEVLSAWLRNLFHKLLLNVNSAHGADNIT